MGTISNSQAPPPTTTPVRTPWHSPVPYLFGGLAAMLGLIAFALLILACSYWRLSSRVNNERSEGQRDIESGNDKEGNVDEKESKVYEEKILVIMAGDQKPSFIATPAMCSCNKASSPTDHNIDNKEEEEEGDKLETGNEKLKDNNNNGNSTTDNVESIENTQTQQEEDEQQQN